MYFLQLELELYQCEGGGINEVEGNSKQSVILF